MLSVSRLPLPTRSAMYTHVYRHRVRYRECDPMGVVYHTHYLDYFEAARTEALRALGLTYRELEDNGLIMPVIEAQIRYLRPARYDDLLEIETRFAEVPQVRVLIGYGVRRAGKTALLAEGRVTLCFMEKAHRRPIRAPERVRRAFAEALHQDA